MVQLFSLALKPNLSSILNPAVLGVLVLLLTLKVRPSRLRKSMRYPILSNIATYKKSEAKPALRLSLADT